MYYNAVKSKMQTACSFCDKGGGAAQWGVSETSTLVFNSQRGLPASGFLHTKDQQAKVGVTL